MDLEALELTIREARLKASVKPGRYGGRYVARIYRPLLGDRFIVLDDDDPDVYREDIILDVICQATPKKVYGLGHARNWINTDGTIDYGFFGRPT